MWNAKTDAHRTAGGFGMLVLHGVLVRRVGFGDRVGGELLGPGDLLRPSEHDGEEATPPFDADWTVLSDLRLALLDRPWSERMAAHPDVSIALAARALRRARRLANMLTIALHPKLDERLQHAAQSGFRTAGVGQLPARGSCATCTGGGPALDERSPAGSRAPP
jgi:CRP/FNR family cyclic AMP-dependent transcriptional regulator